MQAGGKPTSEHGYRGEVSIAQFVTALGTNSQESTYSNEAVAVIP
jgi:hypothetical protein